MLHGTPDQALRYVLLLGSRLCLFLPQEPAFLPHGLPGLFVARLSGLSLDFLPPAPGQESVLESGETKSAPAPAPVDWRFFSCENEHVVQDGTERTAENVGRPEPEPVLSTARSSEESVIVPNRARGQSESRVCSSPLTWLLSSHTPVPYPAHQETRRGPRSREGLRQAPVCTPSESMMAVMVNIRTSGFRPAGGGTPLTSPMASTRTSRMVVSVNSLKKALALLTYASVRDVGPHDQLLAFGTESDASERPSLG